MLQLFKNAAVTSAAVSQADVRQLELDFYTNNYWTWGNTAATIAGFVFSQITTPTPADTPFLLNTVYLFCTSMCLGLNLCIITWTVLCCMWGPGLALRGEDGMKSFHKTVDFLKEEQQWLYHIFFTGVVLYFGSACTLVYVYPINDTINNWSMVLLCISLLLLVIIQIKLEFRIGGSIWPHEGADGRIWGFEAFEDIADLDHHIYSQTMTDVSIASGLKGLTTSMSSMGGPM